MESVWHRNLLELRRVAFDTNALIYLLEGREPHAELVAAALGRLEEGGAIGVISTVVEMELLVKPLREQDIAFVERLDLVFRNLPNLIIRAVDRPVARAAAEIRARDRLGSPDAIIAATAMVEGCDAIIGNDRAMARRLRGISYLCLDDYTT